MTLKKITAAGLLTASALVLAACGQQKSSQSQTKQVLNWTESAQISNQDPSLTTDSTSFQALLNTQEGLYRLDKKQKLQLPWPRAPRLLTGARHILLSCETPSGPTARRSRPMTLSTLTEEA